MPYRIDPSPLDDGTRLVRYERYEREATVVLVGCGGIGGFLAEAICRLLLGRPAQLYLVDPDRVEAHNVARQAFLYGIWRAVKPAWIRSVDRTPRYNVEDWIQGRVEGRR